MGEVLSATPHSPILPLSLSLTVGRFANHILGSPPDFVIDASDVFTQESEGYELSSYEEEQNCKDKYRAG